jgi:transcriptional regulator with XRE-family HTH domain
MEKPVSPIERYVIDAIRKKRMELGISQKVLGEMVDLSIGFMGDVESIKSKAHFNLNHINAIAKALKCSPRELLPENPL